MADLFRTAEAFRPDPAKVRVRFGTVVSVEAGHTCTVTVGGGTVAGVKYTARCLPCPGYPIILLTDGADLFAVDHIAAGDLTLAPRAYRDTDQTITTATDTAVTFAGANSDAWVCWDSGQATRLTAPVTGRYMATAWAKFAANATGLRSAWIYRNGAVEVGRVQVPAASGSPTHLTVASPAFHLEKGDYVQMYVRQNSGGDLALTRDGNVTPSLTLTYLGPGAAGA